VGELHAKGVVDDVADRRAIAGSGETVAKAPILERVGDRALPLFDILKNLNGSSEPAAQTHLRSTPFSPW